MGDGVDVRLCLTRGYLGSELDLVVEGSAATWVEAVPDDAWVLDSGRTWAGRDATTVAALAGVEPTFPDGPSARAMLELGVDPARVPWSKVVPGWKMRDVVRGVVGDVVGALEGPDCGYYARHYEPSRRLLSSLARAKVDLGRLRSHLDAGGGNVAALESFMPEPDGLAQRVGYDILTGRTGRMKVSSGPQVLTLLRGHRDVLMSRFDGGSVVMLDYASLEARVAAYEAGHDPPVDIYADLSARVLGGAPRDTAKVAVLATLFGAGERMLEGCVEPGSAGWLMDRIRDHFDVEGLTGRLRAERLASGGCIRSRGGRRVPCTSAGHILYNSYVQSTGVDVALEGFRRVADEMRRLAMLSVPVFVLHDACIVDMHPDELVYIDALLAVGSDVGGYGRPFPLRVKGLLE